MIQPRLRSSRDRNGALAGGIDHRRVTGEEISPPGSRAFRRGVPESHRVIPR